jgi:hypothetical protein
MVDGGIIGFSRFAHTAGEERVISPGQVSEVLRHQYGTEQGLRLLRTAPSENLARQLRASGFQLIAGPARDLDLVAVCKIAPYFFPKKGDHWWFEEGYSSDLVRGGEWLAITMDLRSESGQQSNLHELKARPANITEIVYALVVNKMLYCQISDGIMFRTSTKGCGSSHLAVIIQRGEIHIVTIDDRTKYSRLGLAVVYDLG